MSLAATSPALSPAGSLGRRGALAGALAFLLLACGGGGKDSPAPPAPPAVQVQILPDHLSLTEGLPETFSATVSNAGNTAVTWRVVEADGGSIDAQGHYLAPEVSAERTIHIQATSVADPGKSAQAAVQVLPFAITAPATPLEPSTVASLRVTLSGAGDGERVLWQAPAGLLDSREGSLVAWAAPGAGGDFQITASLASNAAIRDTVTLRVNPPVVPASESLVVGQTLEGALAVVGEPFSADLQFISLDPLNPITGLAVADADGLGAGTLPQVDMAGGLEWTPAPADAGLRRFDITLRTRNGSERKVTIALEVAQRETLMEGSAGVAGGVFTDAEGSVSLTIPPNALAAGADRISFKVTAVRRANGNIILRRTVTNLAEGCAAVLRERQEPLVREVQWLPSADNASKSFPVGESVADADFIRAAFYRGYYVESFGTTNGGETETWRFNQDVRTQNADTWSFQPRMAELMVLKDPAHPTQPLPLYGKQAVILVHGFTPRATAMAFGEGELGGDTGTWGQLPAVIRDQGAVPFLFRWRTSARFEDQAFHLARAVDAVRRATGRKPILLAHSFGGLLCSTYLAGLAEDSKESTPGHPRLLRYGGDVFALMTVGSPLSGIASGEYATTYTDPVWGLSYTLPTGKDSGDLMINRCNQMTCAEAGAYEQTLRPYKLTSAALMSSSFQKQFFNTFSFYLEPMGGLIGKLYHQWENDNLPDLPIDIFVTSKTTHRPEGDPALFGDGLIAVEGQAAHPGHWSGLDRRTLKNGLVTTLAPANVNYHFMYYDGLWVQDPATGKPMGPLNMGSAHTSLHTAWLNVQDQSSDPNAHNFACVKLDRTDGQVWVNVLSPDSGQMAHLTLNYPVTVRLAELLARVDAENPAKGIYRKYRSNWRAAFSQPSQQLRQRIARARNTAELRLAAEVPWRLEARVLRNGLYETLDVQEGIFDLNGTVSGTFEWNLLEGEDAVDPSQVQLLLTIGDANAYYAVTVTRPYAEEVDFGVEALVSRMATPISCALLLSDPGGESLDGLTCRLRRGTGVSTLDLLKVRTASLTSAIGTVWIDELDVSNLQPGTYCGVLEDRLGQAQYRFTALLDGRSIVEASVQRIGCRPLPFAGKDRIVMETGQFALLSDIIELDPCANGAALSWNLLDDGMGRLAPPLTLPSGNALRPSSAAAGELPPDGYFLAPDFPCTLRLAVCNSLNPDAPTTIRVIVNKSVDALRFALPGGQTLEMAPIPGGTFQMGSPASEPGRYPNEGPQHPVTLSPFHMARVETTQALWVALMGSNPSYFTGDLSLPVDRASWADITRADGFLDRLNAATAGSRPAGMVFRLPTEAEWEYAARAGSTTPYYWGNDSSYAYSFAGEYAWMEQGSPASHPVGGKLPNALGLYDMSGNLMEWCQDWDGPYASGAQTDPAGPASGTRKIERGGYAASPSSRCRSAMRGSDDPNDGLSYTGFRVVLGAPRVP